MRRMIENPSPKTLHARLYRERLRRPCKICGNLCDYRTDLCSHCYLTRTGENHHNWKGGRTFARGKAEGYILINSPGHPRARKNGSPYVLEHILIWEQANNRFLPEGWIIHHLNGIKGDNRIANLVALPGKKHYLLLQAKAKRIQELEALLNNQHQLL